MPLDLRLTRSIDAPATQAFAAFTVPAKLSTWFTTGAEVDLRAGGRYSNNDGDRGEYLDVGPPHRVRFTWDNPDHCAGTVVDVAFESTGPDQSVIQLTHHDLDGPDDYADMEGGWSWALDSLASYLETGIPITHEEWLAQRGH